MLQLMLKRLLKLAALLDVIGAIAYAYFDITWGRAVKRELARLRKAGVPLSPADFAPPPVPDRENAALLYQRAFKAWQLSPQDWESAMGFYSPMKSDKERRKAVAALLPVMQRNREALSLLEQAAQLPRCRFPVDWPKPFELLLGPFAATP